MCQECWQEKWPLSLGRRLLCMTPRARIPQCAWLPGPGYLTDHDSPGQKPDCAKLPMSETSLCMTARDGNLNVHDSSSQDTSLCMTASDSNLNVHDSSSQDTSLCMTARDSNLNVHDSPGQGTLLCMTLRTWNLTGHDSPGQTPHCAWLPGTATLMCMTPRARVPYCAWLSGPETSRHGHTLQARHLTVHHCTGPRSVISSDVSGHGELSWSQLHLTPVAALSVAVTLISSIRVITLAFTSPSALWWEIG